MLTQRLHFVLPCSVHLLADLCAGPRLSAEEAATKYSIVVDSSLPSDTGTADDTSDATTRVMTDVSGRRFNCQLPAQADSLEQVSNAEVCLTAIMPGITDVCDNCLDIKSGTTKFWYWRPTGNRFLYNKNLLLPCLCLLLLCLDLLWLEQTSVDISCHVGCRS